MTGFDSAHSHGLRAELGYLVKIFKKQITANKTAVPAFAYA